MVSIYTTGRRATPDVLANRSSCSSSRTNSVSGARPTTATSSTTLCTSSSPLYRNCTCGTLRVFALRAIRIACFFFFFSFSRFRFRLTVALLRSSTRSMPEAHTGGETNVTGVHFTSKPATKFYVLGDDAGQPFYWCAAAAQLWRATRRLKACACAHSQDHEGWWRDVSATLVKPRRHFLD